MKDVKLYLTKDEYENLQKGEYAFGYAFNSLMEAHRNYATYYGDMEIMQKFRADKLKLYSHNGDVFIFIIKPRLMASNGEFEVNEYKRCKMWQLQFCK